MRPVSASFVLGVVAVIGVLLVVLNIRGCGGPGIGDGRPRPSPPRLRSG
jgi:hypothetical protein